MEQTIEEVRQKALEEFTKQLDRILATWDFKSVINVKTDFTIQPNITYNAGNTRLIYPADKLQEVVDILYSDMSGLIKYNALRKLADK